MIFTHLASAIFAFLENFKTVWLRPFFVHLIEYAFGFCSERDSKMFFICKQMINYIIAEIVYSRENFLRLTEL